MGQQRSSREREKRSKPRYYAVSFHGKDAEPSLEALYQSAPTRFIGYQWREDTSLLQSTMMGRIRTVIDIDDFYDSLSDALKIRFPNVERHGSCIKVHRAYVHIDRTNGDIEVVVSSAEPVEGHRHPASEVIPGDWLGDGNLIKNLDPLITAVAKYAGDDDVQSAPLVGE